MVDDATGDVHVWRIEDFEKVRPSQQQQQHNNSRGLADRGLREGLIVVVVFVVVAVVVGFDAAAAAVVVVVVVVTPSTWQVPLDEGMYGQFFGGDSYIVKYTYRQNKKECYIIYFWQVCTPRRSPVEVPSKVS